MSDQSQAPADVPVRFHIEPREPARNRPQRFLEIFAAILEHSNYGPALDHFARVTARCNRCAVECPVYEVTRATDDIPCSRSHLLLDVYERYFTARGRVKARLFGGFVLTDEHIDRMTWAFYRCTACRKCVQSCPFGVDHGLVTHLARYILSEMDIAPKALVASVRAQLVGEARNTSAVPLAAFKDTLEFLEEELKDATGHDIKFPMDVAGADYIFFSPVSDYIMEADTLMGIAALLHAGGVSWTIGSKNYDAINYGLFYNDAWLEKNLKNLVDEARRLEVKKILIGECGHASRAAKGFIRAYCGERALPVVNILEVAAELFDQGKIALKKDCYEGLATYHDPCNLARSGWIVDQPRRLVRAMFERYVEMTPTGSQNYCCGGGSGLVSCDELKEFRMNVGGLRKAEQLTATGAKYVVTPCANCKKQLKELIEYHKIDIEMVPLHEAILKCLVLPEPPEDERGGARDDDDGEE